MTISAKLFSFLTTGFSDEDFQVSTLVHNRNRPRTLAAMFLTDQIHFSYFWRRSPSGYFYKIILNSENGFKFLSS